MAVTRPLLLDLFCGAGGASMGYHRAGFDIIGVDWEPQPDYPFPFIQADALEPPVNLASFDAIHASPPCQIHSITTAYTGGAGHSDMIPATRSLLQSSGLPFVIENVPGAPLDSHLMLCGSMFDLRVRRHRYFETTLDLVLTPPCQHRSDDQPFAMPWPNSESAYRYNMGCLWMTTRKARQAIPPAYTEFIGAQLVAAVRQPSPT